VRFLTNKKTHGKTTVRSTFTKGKTVRSSTIPHSGDYEIQNETSTIGNGVHNVSFFTRHDGRAAEWIFFAERLRTLYVSIIALKIHFGKCFSIKNFYFLLSLKIPLAIYVSRKESI